MVKLCHRLFLLACCVALSGAASAAGSFRFEGGTVDIPAGFAGPTEQRRDDAGWSLAVYLFGKRHPDRETTTAMQITVMRPPGGVPELPPEEQARGTEKYLLEMLAGVERQRTQFSRGAVESLVIDGKPVAKVAWRGQFKGIPARGVMYCYFHASRIISFHVQEPDSAPAENMAAVTRAFESVSFGTAAEPGQTPVR